MWHVVLLRAFQPSNFMVLLIQPIHSQIINIYKRLQNRDRQNSSYLKTKIKLPVFLDVSLHSLNQNIRGHIPGGSRTSGLTYVNKFKLENRYRELSQNSANAKYQSSGNLTKKCKSVQVDTVSRQGWIRSHYHCHISVDYYLLLNVQKRIWIQNVATHRVTASSNGEEILNFCGP
jgi:hypothetical protein